jgi:dCMP deaminase
MKNQIKERITRDELYLRIAHLIALRGTCQRLQVGCVITSKENRIISTGYNGPLPSDEHCLKCDLTKSCTDAVHAEQNAIAYAAKAGISLEGSTLYLTHNPCITCAKLIIQSGIKVVKYSNLFRDVSGIEILIQNGVGSYHYHLENHEFTQIQNT